MRRSTPTLSVLGAIALPLIFALPSAAQATRTYVSGVGDDANPCSRTAPCKTFAGAISKTAAGGEIDVLDPGGFGGVTITKAITIASEGAGEGGILVSGSNGINVSAGVHDTIILRGLQIDGGSAGNSPTGVKFNTGGVLSIQNCTIRNFTANSATTGVGYGIYFAPSGASSLFVADTVITTNGPIGLTTGGGILIEPTGTGSAKASLVRVSTVNNNLGVRADGTGSTGGITVTVTDSVAASNAYAGYTAFTPAGGATVTMEIMNSTSADNGTGINSHGAGATLRIGYSTVTGNATGVVINGGAMSSLGNNLINDNAVPGAAIPISAPL